MTRAAARPAVLARGARTPSLARPRARVDVPRNRRTLPPAPKQVRPSWGERIRAASDPRRWPKVMGRVDGVLYGTVVALIVFGVVMVYSASFVRARSEFHDGHHYLVRQALFALAGIGILSGLSRVDYHRYRLLAKPLLFVTLCMLALVIGGFGHNAGGAARWIAMGPIHVQPAEVAKVALIVWLADSLAEKSARMGSFWVGFLPHVLVASMLIALCMLQPDFGSGAMMMLLTFVLLFAAGAKIGYMAAGGAIVLPIAYWLVKSSEYRWARVVAFTDPQKYRNTGGYQILQSLLSFGNGGLWGVGLGKSHQKLLYLPEAHTDFIAAIVAEELGFVGFVVLVGAFLLVVARGVRASLRAVDHFGTYLGIGFAMFIGAQAMTNLAVVLGLLPTKGLTLPFLSSGGTSLLVNCAALGVLLNVSRPRTARVGEAVVSSEPRAEVEPRIGSRGTRVVGGGDARGESSEARESARPDALQVEGGTL
jgi:cell division protein FtsW